MIDSKFLETAPLYKPIKYNAVGEKELKGLYTYCDGVKINRHLPAITMYCLKCKDKETFRLNVSGRRFQIYPEIEVKTDILEGIFFVYYRCASCEQHEICFLLEFRDGKVRKVGQSPSPLEFMDDVPASLRQALGSELDVYRKGLMNESVGFGVGAFAYYRRIVENCITGLLNDIVSVAGKEHDAILKTILDSHNVSKKIEVVKDLLPDKLKVDGRNPLSEIYNILSVGIHSSSDEECLDYAFSLRVIFVCLVEGLYHDRNVNKDYMTALNKLSKLNNTKDGVN
jgi:hypothetical protein